MAEAYLKPRKLVHSSIPWWDYVNDRFMREIYFDIGWRWNLGRRELRCRENL